MGWSAMRLTPGERGCLAFPLVPKHPPKSQREEVPAWTQGRYGSGLAGFEPWLCPGIVWTWRDPSRFPHL